MQLYSHFDVDAQETEMLKMTLRIPEYAQNRIMVLCSKGLSFVAIEKDLKESDCPVSRQSILNFVHKFENSPFSIEPIFAYDKKRTTDHGDV